MSTSKILLEGVTVQYENGSKTPWYRAWPGRRRNSGAAPTVVLDNVSAEIQAGELVSILGHSGCGKSTLLKIIAGYTGKDT